MRRAAAFAIAVALSGVYAPSAFADGLPLAGVDATLTGTTSALAPATSPVTQSTSTTSSAVAPVTQTLGGVTGTVADVAGPTVDATTQAIAPVVKTATSVTGSVVASVDETTTTLVQPVAQTVEQVTSSTAPTLGSAPSAGGTESAGTATVQAIQQPPDGSGAPPTVPPAKSSTEVRPTARADASLGAARQGRTDGRSVSHPHRLAPSASMPGIAPTSGSTAHAAARAPRQELPPSAPGAPFGLLGAAFGSGASGGLLLIAALAALVVLAAPRPGRRLRPGSTPWPLPFLVLRPERPG